MLDLRLAYDMRLNKNCRRIFWFVKHSLRICSAWSHRSESLIRMRKRTLAVYRWIYLIKRFVQYHWVFLQVVPYFDEPLGQVKIQTTSKNTHRYYTTWRLIRDLLSNWPDCYFSAGKFHSYLFKERAWQKCTKRNNWYRNFIVVYCFSLFELSYALGSIFASHPNSLYSEK